MKSIIALLFALVCVGCGIVPDKTLEDYRARPLTAQAVKSSLHLVTALKDGTHGLPKVDGACFETPVPTTKVDDCTVARNQVQAALRIASGELCQLHRSTIYGNDAVSNMAFGTLTNFFSGSAAVISHPASKSAASALALLSNSERSLANEVVYKQTVVEAIDAKIGQVRERRWEAIVSAQSQKVSAYGMHQALADIDAYNSACSFMDGLRLALQEGSQSPEIQRENKLRARIVAIAAELNAIAPADRTAVRKDEYDEILARYRAVSAQLQKLEAK